MTAPSPLKLRALRGLTWAAAGGNGAQALAFVMFVLISRVVGPEAFGVVAVALLLVELCRAIACESIVVNLIAAGRADKAPFDAGCVIGVGVSVLFACALAAAAPLLAQLFDMRALQTALPQLAPLLAVHAFARLFEAELTIRMEFRALALRSVAAVTLGGGAGIVSAYAGHGVGALILQQWVAAIASLVLLAASARWRPGLSFSRAQALTLARQSAALAPAGLINSLRQTLDGLAVASFSGAAAAGVYNLAKRSRLALQLGVAGAIGRVSLPAFAQLKGDSVRLASAIDQSTRLSAITAFPLFVGAAAVAPEFIEVFLGPAWRAAAAPMALLMIGGALAITTGLCESVLLVQGRRGAIVALHGAALALLAGGLVAFGRHGPTAVAAVVLAAGVAHNAATWIYALRAARAAHRRSYLANVWAPMAIAVAMLALLAALRNMGAGETLPALARLGVFVLTGALFYIVATWAFARPSARALIGAARIMLATRPAKP